MFRKWSYRAMPLLAALFWLAAALWQHSAEKKLEPARISNMITRDLQLRETHFGVIGRHQADVLAWLRRGRQTSNTNWVFGQDFMLYAFSRDSLIAWSTGSVLPPAHISEGGRRYILSSGAYYGYSYRAAWLPPDISLAVLYPITSKFPLTNEYLQEGFYASPEIDPGTTIRDVPGPGSAPLLDPKGRNIGHVHPAPGSAQPHAPPAWVIISWALALILLCCWVQITATWIARRGKAAWAITLVGATVITIRSLMYLQGLPFHLEETTLFSPRLYAASPLLASLGDLLMNTVAALWVVAFVAGLLPLRKWFDGHALPAPLRWAAGIAVHILLGAGALLFVRLIRSLVLDSQIPFDNVHLSSLDTSSVTGLLIASLLTAILLIGTTISRHILDSLLPQVWAQALTVIAGFMLVLLLRSGESLFPLYAATLVWLSTLR